MRDFFEYLIDEVDIDDLLMVLDKRLELVEIIDHDVLCTVIEC